MNAIVAVGYNRPNSMKRLLNSLVQADYCGDHVDLIISIDKGQNQEKVIEAADQICWNYGEKTIRAFPKKQGLRSHILQCGDLTEKYDSVTVLEDDLVVSKAFYKYIKACIQKYDCDQRIAGISLYSYTLNEFCGERFSPSYNGYDVYMMKVAQSWGQCWTRRMWKEFRSWDESDKEELVLDSYMPSKVFHWGKTSWKKNFMAYVARMNKYFIYPYHSYSSNYSDAGTHNVGTNSDFQVALVENKSQWLLPNFSDSIKYDTFFERECYSNLEQLYPGKTVCMDIYGLKTDYNKSDLLFSRKRLPYKVINKFGLISRPIECNCTIQPEGCALYLYDLQCSSVVPKDKHNEIEWYEYNNLSTNWHFSGRYWIYGLARAIRNRFGGK